MATIIYTLLNAISIPILLLLIAAFVCINWFVNTWKITRTLPPGPFPLPIIGNLHLLRKDIHLSMDRLSERYGSIFTLWMAQIPFVVITDIETARSVCSSNVYTDRLPLYVGGELYTRGSKDMIMADQSPALKLHRKIAYAAIRLFGKDFSVVEPRILNSASTLCEDFANNANQAFDPSVSIDLACFNVMYAIICGETVDKCADSFKKLQNCVLMMMQTGVTLSLLNFYPILRYLPNAELRELLKVLSERDEVLKTIVDRATETFVEGQVTNYVQGLLQAQLDIDAEQGSGAVAEYLSRDHIEMNIFDMFLGGVETSACTVKWALMYFVKFPHTQTQAQEELDQVIGTDKRGNFTAVTFAHQSKLSYIRASILEALRLSSVLPFGVFHKSRQDSVLRGYRLPKGTPTMTNIWTIHHNSTYYDCPFEFRPSRFLDTEGKLLPTSKIQNFFAFSAGPRECVGQLLGKAEIFVFLGNLLYNFRLTSTVPVENLSLYGTTKVTHAPKAFQLLVERRN